MRRRFGNRPRDAWFWGAALLVGASALTRVGNPEAFPLWLPVPRSARRRTPQTPHVPPVAMPAPNHHVDQSHARYQSLFCSYQLPRYPGYSGGEIRDFHLLRHLLSMSSVEFFTCTPTPSDGRKDPLVPYLKRLYTPDTIRTTRPELIHLEAFNHSIRRRIVSRLAHMGVPVIGPRYHRDAAHKFPIMQAYCRAALREALLRDQPDFLFVSPQTNPIAFLLSAANLSTRLILASYDVEVVRMRRIGASYRGLARVALDLETKRAAQFERDNLAFYDGVIAVSELDKQIFVQEYGLAPERVLVIENGVDPDYFAFTERRANEKPQIVFVGSLAYTPNQQAAWRLLTHTMPLVWQRYPEACLWIVGHGAEPALMRQSDKQRVIVTGKVDDVRPYLANASVACVPLISGSGTKYKVLEALSAGVPVVCTPLATEGLDLEDGRDILLGNSDEELAAALLRVIEDAALAATLARQGRERIERCYAWDANLARLDPWLEYLAALPKRSRSASADIPIEQGAGAQPVQDGAVTKDNPLLHTTATNLERSDNNV